VIEFNRSKKESTPRLELTLQTLKAILTSGNLWLK
jgi:hypothetical protein